MIFSYYFMAARRLIVGIAIDLRSRALLARADLLTRLGARSSWRCSATGNLASASSSSEPLSRLVPTTSGNTLTRLPRAASSCTLRSDLPSLRCQR